VWRYVEAAAKREALHMTAQGRDMTVDSCEKLRLKIPSALKYSNNSGNNDKNSDNDMRREAVDSADYDDRQSE
jgi:hypothetical protein